MLQTLESEVTHVFIQRRAALRLIRPFHGNFLNEYALSFSEQTLACKPDMWFLLDAKLGGSCMKTRRRIAYRIRSTSFPGRNVYLEIEHDSCNVVEIEHDNL